MKLPRVFRIREQDRPVLGLLSPIFASVTATLVMTVVLSKTLYIDNNDVDELPWMYIVGAVFTTVASMFYVSIITRGSGTKRFEQLLVVSAVSFVALGVLTPLDPQALSLVVYAWCTAIGTLLIIQTWAWCSIMLPTRQARRLFPMLSAVATLGAAGGGALTRAVLGVAGSQWLLFFSAVLVTVGLVFVRLARLRLPGAVESTPSRAIRRGQGPVTASREARSTGMGRLLESFRALREVPLLGRLAALAFLAQGASVLIDLQLSSALKQYYQGETSGDRIGVFFSIYYLGANLLIIVVALFFARVLTRWMGIGLAAGSTTLFLGIGGVVMFVLDRTSDPAALFWATAATSFAERVAQFALAKQAMEAATIPVDPAKAEPAKFLINGVVSRFLVVGVGVATLFLGKGLSDYGVLTPALVVASLLAVFVGLRIGPSYVKALFNALGDPSALANVEVPSWAGDAARRAVKGLLRKPGAENIHRGLALVQELGLPLEQSDIEQLLDTDDEPTLLAVLNALELQSVRPSEATFKRLLAPDMPQSVICSALRVLPQGDESFQGIVSLLASHENPAVASRAVMWLRGAQADTRVRRGLRDRVRFQSGLEPASIGSPRPSASEMSRLTEDPLMKRYIELVDQLPTLLVSNDKELQRLATDVLVQLAIPEHVDLLLDALDDPSHRPVAVAALGRLPRALVLEALESRLRRGESLPLPSRIRLIQLCESLGGEDAVQLLTAYMDDRLLPIRYQAVKCLWHLAREPAVERPPSDLSTRLVKREVRDLIRYAIMDESLASRPGPRRELLRQEVALRRAQAENLMFRLLGMLFDRDAIERARVHSRDSDRRTRSNAIELLETTVTDPDLRMVVTYVEGTEHAGGRSYTTASMIGVKDYGDLVTRLGSGSGDAVEALLEPRDGILGELYQWAKRADDKTDASRRTSPDALWWDIMADTTDDEVMEHVFLLRGVPLFDEIPAEQLLPLAQVAQRKPFSGGATIFKEGDAGDVLYLIIRGRVSIRFQGRELATLGPRECFGEMAILDNQPRSADAVAAETTECLTLHADDFDNLLEIAPGLARGVIRVLTRRLRAVRED